MKRHTATVLGSLVLAALASATVATAETAGGVTFLPLGDLAGGDFYSVATGVSADGTTVVGYSKASTASSPLEAFRWTETDGMVGLGGLSSPPGTRASGVSADGSVVVLAVSGAWPILWTQSGGLVEIADTTGTLQFAYPRDLSADGATIVGNASEAAAPANQAFRWTAAAGYELLGFLPSTIHDSFMTGASADGSVLCGFSFHAGSDVEPMIWTEAAGLDSLGDVPGGDPYALAWGISDDGTTVVGDAHIGGASEPWLWREATGFFRPDSTHGAGWFEAVSADGSVAVGVPAIVWDSDHGLRHLADIVTNAGIDVSDWLFQGAKDVSADGRTIAGYGQNPSGDTEAWLIHLPLEVTDDAPVPAPVPSPLALEPLGANPTRSESVFRLSLPAAGRVRAEVFAVDGRHVRTLGDSPMPAGEHTVRWDGTDDAGRHVARGTYFLRVVAGPSAVARKIVRLD